MVPTISPIDFILLHLKFKYKKIKCVRQFADTYPTITLIDIITVCYLLRNIPLSIPPSMINPNWLSSLTFCNPSTLDSFWYNLSSESSFSFLCIFSCSSSVGDFKFNFFCYMDLINHLILKLNFSLNYIFINQFFSPQVFVESKYHDRFLDWFQDLSGTQLIACRRLSFDIYRHFQTSVRHYFDFQLTSPEIEWL